MTVLVDSSGKLGTVLSSARYKQDVRDISSEVELLDSLRPVSFRYRPEAEAGDDGVQRYGLIAEEVAAVFPELVVFDDQGRPLSVKYHLISSLLLAQNQRQEAELAQLRERIEALEGAGAQ